NGDERLIDLKRTRSHGKHLADAGAGPGEQRDEQERANRKRQGGGQNATTLIKVEVFSGCRATTVRGLKAGEAGMMDTARVGVSR
ncbi:hypothetical protein, partial [Escherichia coli]|uniref:hypothetical protein n=1 Tax=Escherichia coli TaxID=562 RepID=UPI0019539BC0